MKDAFAGFEYGLTEMCFPFPGLGHLSINYLKVILRQHCRITLAASLEKIYSHILGGVMTIRLII